MYVSSRFRKNVTILYLQLKYSKYDYGILDEAVDNCGHWNVGSLRLLEMMEM